MSTFDETLKLNGSGPKLGVDIYTTGQASKITGVAPRTVSKWCDTGRLKSYRIPAVPHRSNATSGDRRIRRSDLVDFLVEIGNSDALRAMGEVMPGGTMGTTLLVGVESHVASSIISLHSWCVISQSLFAAGAFCYCNRPTAVIFDSSIGRHEILHAAQTARSWNGCRRLVAIVLIEGDDNKSRWESHDIEAIMKPLDMEKFPLMMKAIMARRS